MFKILHILPLPLWFKRLIHKTYQTYQEWMQEIGGFPLADSLEDSTYSGNNSLNTEESEILSAMESVHLARLTNDVDQLEQSENEQKLTQNLVISNDTQSTAEEEWLNSQDPFKISRNDTSKAVVQSSKPISDYRESITTRSILESNDIVLASSYLKAIPHNNTNSINSTSNTSTSVAIPEDNDVEGVKKRSPHVKKKIRRERSSKSHSSKNNSSKNNSNKNNSSKNKGSSKSKSKRKLLKNDLKNSDHSEYVSSEKKRRKKRSQSKKQKFEAQYSVSSRSLFFQDYLSSLEDLIEIQKKTMETYQQFMKQFQEYHGKEGFYPEELDVWWFNLNRTQNYVFERSVAKHSTASELLSESSPQSLDQSRARIKYHPTLDNVALSHLPQQTTQEDVPLVAHARNHTHLGENLDYSTDFSMDFSHDISHNISHDLNPNDHQDTYQDTYQNTHQNVVNKEVAIEKDGIHHNSKELQENDDYSTFFPHDVAYTEDSIDYTYTVLSEDDLKSHPSIDFITFDTTHQHLTSIDYNLSEDHSWSYNDSFDMSVHQESLSQDYSDSYATSTYKLKLKKSKRSKNKSIKKHVERSISYSSDSQSLYKSSDVNKSKEN
jgi:hypothetical protein